jgi:biotin operon repressor
MGSRQLFFTPEGEYWPTLKSLSRRQRSVLSLLNCGLLQAGVAERLHVSRPYVNQIVRHLESLGLVMRRKPSFFYDLSPEAKSLLAGSSSLDDYTPARLHNFKKKFRILSVVQEPSLDARAQYLKSWKMRGSPRHKFWYSGSGIPSVTVDYHIRTLVIYIDRGQNILARTVEEAEALGWLAIQKARDRWVHDQRAFGREFVVDEVGTVIGKPHAGFLMKDSDMMIRQVLEERDGAVGYADYWVDKSPEKELGVGWCEAETAELDNMTRLGRGIQFIEHIDENVSAAVDKVITPAVPAALAEMNGKMGGLGEGIMQVQAMLQGSITTAQQNDNILKFLSKIMEEMQQIRLENAELRKKLLPQ